MARIDLYIPSLEGKFTDIRDNLPGDSFNWSWVRPLSQVRFLAIHHSGGPDTQTPSDIAELHVGINGWGGIGYHFIIGKDGVVYYVGDIGSARANVANLNEQVIGICLTGNFIEGREPTPQQIDSTQKLCDFLIRNCPDLSAVTSWDSVLGHKELPNQATICPGDRWSVWKQKIVPNRSVTPQIQPNFSRRQQRSAPPKSDDIEYLKTEVDNLQTTLASVNQQVISLQETLQEKDKQILDLKFRLSMTQVHEDDLEEAEQVQKDNTISIFGILILFYKVFFPPRKEALG